MTQDFESSGKSSYKIKQIYYSTVISIALVSTMMGLFGLIVSQANKLSQHVKENIALNVIFSENAQLSSIDSVKKVLIAHPYVKEIKYISKEDAAKILQADLGEDFLNFLGYNPLLPIIEVKVKSEYAQPKYINLLKEEMSQNTEVVKEASYQKNLLDSVNENIRIISFIILGFMIMLSIISIGLINNSVRLIIYSQRFIIKSMQLIGATKGFIRKPYMFYGFMHGFLGGISAIIILSSLLYILRNQLPEIIALQDLKETIFLFSFVLAFSIVLSVISSFFAVNRYLRLKIHELYK